MQITFLHSISQQSSTRNAKLTCTLSCVVCSQPTAIPDLNQYLQPVCALRLHAPLLVDLAPREGQRGRRVGHGQRQHLHRLPAALNPNA